MLSITSSHGTQRPIPKPFRAALLTVSHATLSYSLNRISNSARPFVVEVRYKAGSILE